MKTQGNNHNLKDKEYQKIKEKPEPGIDHKRFESALCM